MGAGDYYQKLKWWRPSVVVDDTGDNVETYEFIGTLWGYVLETNGRRADDAGAVQTGTDVEIHVRNYPDVLATDLLEDPFWQYTYHIDSIRNGDDEIIVDAYRDDVLINFNKDSS